MTTDGLKESGHLGQPRLANLLDGPLRRELTIGADVIPVALLEANDMVRAGRIDAAKALLAEDAVCAVEALVAEQPELTDVMYILAKLLVDTGQDGSAEPWYRRILEVEPHAVAWADLAGICSRRPGHLRETVDCWRQACILSPDDTAFRAGYADSLLRMGRVAEAVEAMEDLARLTPEDTDVEHKLLWNLHYLPGYDRAFFYDRYSRLGRRHGHPRPGDSRFSGPLDPDRRLRVGIVSGDFKANSPGTLYEPVIGLHDRRQFEFYGYGNVLKPDRTTGRIAALFDVYRDIAGQPDDQVAELIRQDRIDILVEIGGFCKGSRLGVFLRRPAPIQVDLGGISTLGLPQVGFRITDDLLDPPDAQRYYTEKLVYLAGGFEIFRPPAESPCIGPLPESLHGHVTFGSFNSLRKINDVVLSVWAEILKQVPDARMVLKFPSADDAEVRDDVRQRFRKHGIDDDRISLLGTTSYLDHLCLLEQVDLLLDCFPFNGARTTLEGLWMGVPTVTLVGDTWASQVGRAILTRVGLGQFITRTPEQYVSRACRTVGLPAELDAVRQGLRERLLSSPLCDPCRFTRELEAAFRRIWRDACVQTESPIVSDERWL